MSGGYAGKAASHGPSGRSATPFHCPFCGDEDLRPAEDGPAAWSCRSCARVFTVSLVRVDHASIPAHVPVRDPADASADASAADSGAASSDGCAELTTCPGGPQ